MTKELACWLTWLTCVILGKILTVQAGEAGEKNTARTKRRIW